MLLNKMKTNIKDKGIKIVLTEAHDLRVAKAARQLADDHMVMPVICGDLKVINELFDKENISSEGFEMHDIKTSPLKEKMVQTLFELRKGKHTIEQCEEMLTQSNYFGTMLVYMNYAAGLVGGATYSTADTVRPALQIVKTKPGHSVVSSSFIMYKPEIDHKLVMGDCAINIEPSSQDLANIAIQTAETARVFDIEPKVALLSFSTKGSGKGVMVDKVVEAKKMLDEKTVDFEYDGEFQFDAAIDESVGQLKAPGSTVAGFANVFIFPTLESGNIGYKIAQRLGGYEALGPILQGLNAPINDLSRGCSIQDVYNLVVVTASQSLQ